MESMKQEWTKFSDRLPPEEIDTVFVETRSGHIQIWERDNTMNRTWKDYAESNDKWHPITYPELPKREETQGEKDATALKAWAGKWRDCPFLNADDAWHAALRYERAENAKDLEEVVAVVHTIPTGNRHAMAVKRLRKRAGLDK
jgi:hypothetical protein